MDEKEKKEIGELQLVIKEFVEKKYGEISNMEEKDCTKAFLNVYSALSKVMKRDFNYLLIIENK